MNREHLESAAAGYPYLRGLLSVPLGLVLILSALGNWDVGPLRDPWVFVAAAAVIGASGLLVNRYYGEHFGRVTPSQRQQRRWAGAAPAGAAIRVGATFLLRSRAAWSLALPVNPIPAAFAALMLVYYAAVVGLRPHHVLIWGAVLVAGLVPLWNGADPSNVGLVMAGAAGGLQGVVRPPPLLARVAPPPPPAARPRDHRGGRPAP